MDEEISRRGCFITLKRGPISRERSYRDEAAAKRAYEALIFCKEARDVFMQTGKVRGIKQ